MDTHQTAPGLPDVCFALHPETGKCIALVRGERGYFQCPGCSDPDVFNAANGITAAQVLAMQIGSMFGWDVPGADPANAASLLAPVTP